MPPHDQPWLAFSRVQWRGGFERRLVRIFDDRIEVRAGRFAIETKSIPMAEIYDVELTASGAVRVVAVPDDVVITEGTDQDRALAADLIRRNAPPPRKKPKPKPKPKAQSQAQVAPPRSRPTPQPKPQSKPQSKPQPKPAAPPKRADPPPPQPDERPAVAQTDPPSEASAPPETQAPAGVPDERHRLRALALLGAATVLTAVAIVAVIGGFLFVVVRLVSG